jgi:hypothetical protein
MLRARRGTVRLALFWRHCMRINWLVVTAALVSGASIAHAVPVIGGAAGTPNNRTDGGKVVGASFNSHGNTIGALGFFDYQQDGIVGTYQLGLWNSAQTLVGTATVTPSSPLVGDFRWANMASPVTLGAPGNPETFTIGVLLESVQQDVWQDNVFPVLGSGYTGAGTGRFSGPSGTLVYPNTLDSSAYYVVNGGDAVPVPEPMSVGLLGLGGVLLLRRRRYSR